MIQRIQTLYLAVSAILLALLFVPMFAPIRSVETLASGEVKTLSVTAANSLPLLFFVVTAFTFVFMAIFLFKNRKIQMFMAATGGLWCAVLIGVLLYQKMQLAKVLTDTQTVSFGIGLAAPILALVLTVLAIFAIRKDESLVRSSDRLR